jgi:membrane protease YdiL (CAAX protease family)
MPTPPGGGPADGDPDEPVRWPVGAACGLVIWYIVTGHVGATWALDLTGTMLTRTEVLVLDLTFVIGSTFAIAVYFSHRYGTGHVRDDFHLRFRMPRDVGLGVCTGVANIVVSATALVVLQAMTGTRAYSDTQALVTAHHLDPALFWVYVAAGVTFVPVIEELLFRGLLLDAMLSRLPAPAAFAI